jgi:hypothetical protein
MLLLLLMMMIMTGMSIMVVDDDGDDIGCHLDPVDIDIAAADISHGGHAHRRRRHPHSTPYDHKPSPVSHLQGGR